MYEELIRLHQEEGLSFRNVITFNLDEYYPMEKDNVESYHYFIQENLFKHIDVKHENIHIPNGMISQENLDQYCLDYEAAILNAGGLDFQLFGIEKTWHIGNEPSLPTVIPIKKPQLFKLGFHKERRRHTLPHNCSTICAGGLNYSVRDGKR